MARRHALVRRLRSAPVLAAALCIFTTSLTPARAPAADAAGTLLAKHRAYVGWEMDDGSIRNLVLDGSVAKVNADGTRTPIQRVHEIDVRVLYRSTVSGITTRTGSQEGLDLTGFWYRVAGFTIPNIGENRGVIFARRIVFSEALSTLNPQPHGTATIEGVAYDILRGAIDGWKPIDLYVDPASGAIKQFVYDPDAAKPEITMIDAYMTVLSSKRVVSAWHVPGSAYERSYARIVPNAAVTDADLKPPAPRTTWTFAGGKPTPVDVEVDKIIVPATVNGVTGHFLLDTGATVAMTSRFAARAGLKPGRRPISRERPASDTALGRALHSPSATAAYCTTPTCSWASRSPRARTGCVGFNFLAGAIVDIDMDQAKMTIYDPATSQPNEDKAIIMHVDLSNETPRTPIKLGGTIPSTAMLDSGASGTEFVTDKAFFSKVVMDRARSGVYAFQGASGAEGDSRCGTIDEIDIGPVPYTSPSICFAKWPGPGNTIMGFGFLSALQSHVRLPRREDRPPRARPLNQERSAKRISRSSALHTTPATDRLVTTHRTARRVRRGRA